MKFLFPLALVSALGLCAQTPAPAPAGAAKAEAPAAQGAKPEDKPVPTPKGPPTTYQVQIPAAAVVPIMALPPETVIATADGEKVTAGDLQVVLRSVPPQAQQMAQNNRRLFVEQYGMLRRLSKEAREAKLDQKSPWKEMLEYAQLTVLYRAAIENHAEHITVTPAEAKTWYETRQADYERAKVKAIYLPFSTVPVSQADPKGKPLPSEAEAKAKAEELVKQLRAGADFDKLAKENSSDEAAAAAGKENETFIRKNDPLIPADVKKALFASKPGDITDPVRQAHRFCIFRVEEVGTQPYEEVQAAITEQVKGDQMRKWFTELQKSIDIKMEYDVPAVAQPVPAPAPTVAQPVPAPAPTVAQPAAAPSAPAPSTSSAPPQK
jgi:peptidyl-prolyl cis-trans isomerase C